MTRRFVQVDVFGTGPLTGNPLAVVVDGDGLSSGQMQTLARWTNLSETTFLLPPTQLGADYRVRIFSQVEEYPFAGHPTLGSAHAWLESGGVPRTAGTIVQECGAGLVPVRAGDGELAFAAPPRTRVGDVDQALRAEVADAIGIPEEEWVAAAWGVNGPPWLMVQLASADAVRAVRRNRLNPAHHIGLVGLEPEGAEHAYEVRALTDGFEDPVTGSLNAAAAQWFRERGLVPARYTVAQGSQIGRAGRVTVHDDGTDIWIGGRVTTVIRGTCEI